MLLHIVLVIDDGARRKRLKDLLSQPDTIVDTVKEGHQLTTMLSRRICDLAVISRSMMREHVLDEIHQLKELSLPPAVVVLTDQEDEQETARLVAAGCEAVLHMDVEDHRLVEAINAVLERRRKIVHISLSAHKKVTDAGINDFATKSPVMTTFVKNLPRIARSHSSVLILGETGVGKERLARALHMESPRRDRPFIPVHCGALPETLLESELFGHEQGAFTGAIKARRGCFELAHNGTLFLDEIGEMPPHLQSKLLRVLESREIRRLGGEKPIVVDVRILAATNRDLEEEVCAKQFRKDLYYRLNVVSLTIPPLRDRREDIPELVHHYIETLGPKIGHEISGIVQEALDTLCQYQWPGNIRELINIIERAMLLCEDNVITIDDLPVTIASGLAVSGVTKQDADEASFDAYLHQSLKQARQELITRFERVYLTRLLREKHGRVGEVAQAAGIDVRSLFDKMKYYGLSKEDYKIVSPD